MKSFSIFGCCVSRDIFNFNYQGNYEVDKFLQNINFYSFYSGKIYQQVPQEEFGGKRWQKQCAYIDLNKTLFDVYDNFSSDYFIVDVGELRCALLKLIDYENNSTRVCSTVASREFCLDKDKLGKYGIKVEENIDPFNHTADELEEAITYFCKNILKRYSPEQIIINEVKFVDNYLDINKEIKNFVGEKIIPEGYAKKINDLYDVATGILKKKLCGCHIIRFPENVIADELHMWGRSPQRYLKEYYEYCNLALNIITGKHADEEKLLCDLRDRYSNLFLDIVRQYDTTNILSKNSQLAILQTKFDHKYPMESLGMNTGNLLFFSALNKLLSAEKLPYNYKKMDIELQKYKSIVITDLIWINENSVYPLLEQLVQDYRGKIIPISIGLQANNYDNNFKIHTRTLRLLHSLGERCILGVRGNFTAEILNKNGIKNIEVIGCPSLFWNNRRSFKIKNDMRGQGEEINVMANFRTFWGRARLKERKFLRYCANNKFRFVEQTNHNVTLEFLNNDKPFYKYINEYMQQFKTIYFNEEEWRKATLSYDFSIGMRFHGNIMALRNGHKALFIIHDSRTRELTDYFNLPVINIEDFDDTKQINYYYNLADYSSFNSTYGEKFDRFMNFLKKNGLQPTI